MKKKPREKGPVEKLCDEIGATFTKNMESIVVLKAFVSVLVNEVEEMAGMDSQIAHLTGKEVPDETYSAIEHVKSLLTLTDREELIKMAGDISMNAIHVPDEGPCNHYVDMLSSCVSAIWFGLERPCRSRHAAEAVNHIWRKKYGVTLFDQHSPAWGRQWACAKFYEALAVAADK